MMVSFHLVAKPGPRVAGEMAAAVMREPLGFEGLGEGDEEAVSVIRG
jgi:hypothetical protein